MQDFIVHSKKKKKKKKKFSIKDFFLFGKCDQIMKKSLMENFIFCALYTQRCIQSGSFKHLR